MKIVPSQSNAPTGRVTSRGFGFDDTDITRIKMSIGPEINIQNCPAPRITATTADYAAKRKMYGGHRHTYVVGTVAAQPDNFGDHIRQPKPAQTAAEINKTLYGRK